MLNRVCLVLVLLLSGCVSERHFARDSWPFGNPNAPHNDGESAQRALGKNPDVTPIAPQAGNVWPGEVQPVPTLSQEQQDMNQPLGQAYTPSLPSPYPPGEEPPPNADLGIGPLGAPGTQNFVQPGSVTNPMAPMPGAPGPAPSVPAAPSPPAASPAAPSPAAP